MPALWEECLGTLDIHAVFHGQPHGALGHLKEHFITAETLLIAWCPQCATKDGWNITQSKKSLSEVSLPQTRVQQEVLSGSLHVTHSGDCWHNGF